MAVNALFGPRLRPRQSRRCWAVSRSAFTLLEITVATVVLGIAVAGLFPLLVVMSRDLQPMQTINADGSVTYSCRTPARDGNTSSVPAPPSGYVQHTWYLAAAGDLTSPSGNPNATNWARKLGGGARFLPVPMNGAAPSAFTAATTPNPVQPSAAQQDGYEGVPGADDGTGTFSTQSPPVVPWTYYTGVTDALGADTHRHEALPKGQTSADSAIWTLTALADGWYAVQATWPASADQVNDAVYTVCKNGTPLADSPVIMNQAALPVGVTDVQGKAWANLATHAVQLAKNDVITVQLSVVRGINDSEVGKFVVADGVRLAQNEVQVKSLDRALNHANNNNSTPQADVTVRVKVIVNLPE
jgi:hypothetical protein